MKKHYNPSGPQCHIAADTSPSRDTLTLKKIASLICKFRLDQPRPLAIWFVDRPAEYYHLLKITDTTSVPAYLLPVRLYDIPLKQFTRSVATEQELAIRPFFCRFPGIWIEMSDGNHVRLGETK